MLKFFNKKFTIILGIILGLEILSLVGNIFSTVNQITFLAIMLATLIFSLKNLKYGILIMLAELFIGSMGYLFFFDLNGTVISLRLGIWLIIMSTWLVKEILYFIHNKKIDLKFAKSKYFKYYLVLFAVIILSFVNGLIQDNGFNNIFLDANNWFYLAIIFPLYSAIKKDDVKRIIQVFTACITWISAKTLFVLFVSSHKIYFGDTLFFQTIYKWVRDTRIGEITFTEYGFYRVFFQSHIFVLIGLFLFLFFYIKEKKTKKNILTYLPLISLFSATIIISMSRSMWLGLGAGLLSTLIIMIFLHKEKIKNILISSISLIVVGVLSIGIILAVVNFPYPEALNSNALKALTDRTKLTGEAGISSRWNLLPALTEEIKKSPLIGKGFGKTVTYKTEDPRVLSTSADGQYTTYAFEWGWLDIWLKFGIIGLLAYFSIFFVLIFNTIKEKTINYAIITSLIIGLIALLIVNIFTPYLNHPLGLGYLTLMTIIIEIYSKKNSIA